MICDRLADIPNPSRHPPGDHLTAVEYGTHEETDQEGMADSAVVTFVHRPKVAVPAAIPESDMESSDDDQGFTLVSRPKPQNLAPIDESTSSPGLIPTPVVGVLAATDTDYYSDEPMSSPELVPTPAVDIPAATSSDYSSDDDWMKI
jgi:hypothetical protein